MKFTEKQIQSLERVIEMIFTSARRRGCVAIPVMSGCFIETGNHLSLQQKDWADGDSAKNVDFTLSPFWLTDDYGRFPTAIDAKGLKDLLSK